MLNFDLVGKRFSELRNRSGFTQSMIAEYLDVDQSYISKCEKMKGSLVLMCSKRQQSFLDVLWIILWMSLVNSYRCQ